MTAPSPPNSMPADSVPATPNDHAMMARALELAAHAASIGEVPVGAVVYRGEQILGEGYNRRESDHDPTAHAEMLAMRQAAEKLQSWRLDECTLAVTLEPCPMCAGGIVNARVARLVYGTTDPKMGCVHTLHHLCSEQRFNHRVQLVQCIQAEACAQLLKAFFRARRGNGDKGKPNQPAS